MYYSYFLWKSYWYWTQNIALNWFKENNQTALLKYQWINVMNMFPASFVEVMNDTDPPVRDIFRVHTLHFILFVIYKELSWPNTVTRIKGKACDTSELRSHIQLSCEFTSWILMWNSYSDTFLPSLTFSFPAGPKETPLIPHENAFSYLFGGIC